jgi:hypothetical protein
MQHLARTLAFLIGCMGARLLLAAAMFMAPPGFWVQFLALMCIAIAIGFTVIYVMGWRKTGIETGNSPIWWNALRPVHAVLFFAAGIAALAGMRRAAATILIFDTAVGLTAYLIHKSTTK